VGFSVNFTHDATRTVELTAGDKTVYMSHDAGDSYELVNETNEMVLYETADNRKMDIYRFMGSDEIKNYTVYSYPKTQTETETYTFKNAVLHENDEGEIKIYYS